MRDPGDAPVTAVPDAPEAPAVGEAIDVASLQHRFLAWAFGVPVHLQRPAAGDGTFVHLEGIAQRFDVRRMPRLPALVPQLLAAMRRDDADAAAIASLLERDATLAGDVIRMAGSAFYRRGEPASGLQQAVRTIGYDGLRHVVLGSVMRPILRGDAGAPGFAIAARLWAQSEARTWLCGRLAPGRCDVGEAQLAGIVAGTGIAALSRMAPAQVLEDAAADPASAARFLALASPLNARAGAHWQLATPVLAALQPDSGTALSTVLRAADRLAMGYRLIEAGDLPAEAAWETGIAEFDSPTARARLFASMAGEIERLDDAPD